MTLRFLMVSLVSSLGLALPSGDGLDSWSRSGRTWWEARLTEWGTAHPAGDGPYVYLHAVEPKAPEAPAPARPGTMLLTASETKVAPAKTEAPAASKVPTVARDLELEAAFDEWTVSLTLAPVPVPVLVPAPAATKSLEVPAWMIAKAADRTVKAVETLRSAWAAQIKKGELVAAEMAIKAQADLDFEVSMATEEVAARTAWTRTEVKPAPIAADPDRAFRLVMEETAATFAADSRPSPIKFAAEIRAAEIRADPDRAFKVVMAETASTFAKDVAPTQPAAAVLSATATPALKAAKPAGAERLVHALRKTREAVNAWASLLHGPAIVTIDR